MQGKQIAFCALGIGIFGAVIVTPLAVAESSDGLVNQSAQSSKNMSTTAAPKKRSIFSYIWGQPVKNSIFYEPLGSHTKDGHRKLKWFQLAGFTYHSFFAMTFINSFNDRTYALGMQRYVYQNKIIALGYGFGLMYGYNGRLANVGGIPFRNSFLFKYDINPLACLLADINLSKRVKMSFVITPLVLTVGLRILIGKDS